MNRADSEGLPTLEVAARMIEQAPGITRLLNTLAAKRYIRRNQCPQDRRQQLCRLTAMGRRLLDAVVPRVQESHARMVKELKGREQAESSRCWNQFAAAC